MSLDPFVPAPGRSSGSPPPYPDGHRSPASRPPVLPSALPSFLATAPPPASEAAAWRIGGGSVRGLRVLVGVLVRNHDASLRAALLRWSGRPAPAPPCRLLFHAVAAALASPGGALVVDAVLAAHLAPAASRWSERSLFELAAAWEREAETLDLPALVALLWTVHVHPSRAARRLEDRVADTVERRLGEETIAP